MKACGIIVEYNPFHNGHLYHAQMARQRSGAEVVIAVMSGNFLQRGEPAILDKWTRASQALKNGVDLVVELPVAYAVQSADYFAKGGIELLQALACEAICFGTDNKNEMDYEAFGIFVVENREKIEAAYQKVKNNGMSYPQQMTEVFREIYPENKLDFSSPNHILAMGYAKENAKFSKPMRLLPIFRKESNYHDQQLGQTIASATAVRQSILTKGEVPENVLPPATSQDLNSFPLVNWDNYWAFLRYKILTSTVGELRQIYQMKEGIEYRLKEKVVEANSFSEFIEKVKSKRYTWTRLQRLFTYILLNVKEEQVKTVWDAPYLRILGFSQVGRHYLHEKKAQFTLPLITKLSKKHSLDLDVKAGQIYQLGHPKILSQDVKRVPIIFD